MLFVVATPIGNLGDMSPRAIEILQSVDLIAAEDTRHSIKLMNHFQIHKSLTSLHEHNELGKSHSLVQQMVEDKISIALISDAGTPAVSDPGALFVKSAVEAGIEVIAIPGPSAAIAALSISGFDKSSFTFYGFLPRETKALQQKLQSIAGKDELVILYESPFRVKKLLQAILESLGDVPISLSCDLSKLHELTLHGKTSEIIEALQANEKAEKGEYVLVMDLSGTKAALQEFQESIALEARLLHLMMQGLNIQDAMAKAISSGQRRNAVYTASLRLKKILKDEYADLIND